MKNVLYLIVVLSLLFTSCCKEDPVDPIDEGLITLSELNGTWEPQKYVYNGVDYFEDDPTTPTEIINFLLSSDKNFNSTTMEFFEVINPSTVYEFSKDMNAVLIWKEGSGSPSSPTWQITVVAYDGVELHLKIDYRKLFTLNGGTLVLTK
jgi:hypothetical protein